MGYTVFSYKTGTETQVDDDNDEELPEEDKHNSPILPWTEEEPPESEDTDEYVRLDDGYHDSEILDFGENAIEPWTIFGDRPDKVDEPRSWPRQCVGFIRMTWNGVPYRGSGVLVAPNKVLTCAHNVWPRPERITFRPGQTARMEWIGKHVVKSVHVPDSYRRRGERGAEYDYAMMTLEDSPGTDLGYWEAKAETDEFFKNKIFEITGYPGLKRVTNNFYMRADVGSMKKVKEMMFYYKISTAKGMSGGPIWIEQNEKPYIVGVHNTSGPYYNYGARLTETKMRRIAQWIHET